MIDVDLEKIRESKRRYKRNNREKIRRSNAVYRENNKDKIKICNINYRRRNKDKIKKRIKIYYKNNSDRYRVWVKEKKIKAFEYKLNIGCQVCGYKKCSEALDFHHTSSEAKIIDVSRLVTRKWEDFLSEAKKCIVVCRNCHAEIHRKLRNNLN